MIFGNRSACLQPIFEYLEYREFLREFYQEKKKENFFFSFQFMGRKVGVDPSALAKVLAGQRHLANQKISLMADLCELEGRHADYFEALVHFCKAKSQKQSREWFEKLLKIRANSGHVLSARQYKFYSHWYYTAIRAILGIEDFRIEDAAKIGKRLDPPLQERRVSQSLKFLLTHGLISENEDGWLRPVHKHISSGNPREKAVDVQSIRRFQAEMIEQAKNSLENHDPQDRDFSTMTVAIGSEALDDVREIIAECRRAVRERLEMCENADTVYQLNMQFFPISRREK